MKKLLLGLLLLPVTSIFAQSYDIDSLSLSTYIFKLDVPVSRILHPFLMDTTKKNIQNGWVAFKGTPFTVIRILDTNIIGTSFTSGDLIVNFKVTYYLKKDSSKKIVQKEFFILKQSDFAKYAKVFVKPPSPWDVSFGALTLPFKLRFNPFNFNANASIGTSVFLQHKNQNFSYGLVFGLSLSSVLLDSTSTKGSVITGTQRPAFTPSLGLIVAWKNISLTFGPGWDIINLTSSIEKSWIYQGKTWFGLGIGINLFSPNTSNTNPTPILNKTSTNAPIQDN